MSVLMRISTNEPFHEALQKLMKERDVSFRSLVRLTDAASQRGKGYSVGYLSSLTKGPNVQRGTKPTVENIQILAAALNVSPEYFREYREHLAAQRAKAYVARHGFDNFTRLLDDADPLNKDNPGE